MFKAVEFTRWVKPWARVSLFSFHSMSQIKAKKDWSTLFWILQKNPWKIWNTPPINIDANQTISIVHFFHERLRSRWWNICTSNWFTAYGWELWIVTYSMSSGLLEAYCWVTNVFISYWVVGNILFGHNIGKLIQWLLAC